MKYFFILLFLLFVKFLVSQNELQKGINLLEKSEFDAAKAIFQVIEAKAIIYPDTIILQAKNNLGNIYADLGQNSNALKKYQEALTLAYRLKSKLNEAKVLKNIGAIYISWKNFKKAKTYYFKALKIALKQENDNLIGDCYNNLGTVFEQENNLEKAIEVYLKALNYYLKSNIPIDIAMVYSNLAIVYKSQGKIEESISYNKKALNTASEMKDLWMLAAIANNLGNTFREQKQFDSAFVYVNQSLQISHEIEAIEIEIMAFETLSDIYKDKKEYKKALEATKKMQILNQQFINVSQTKQVNELEVKFKTKQKELENERLKFEKKQVVQQNKLMLVGILLFFAILILILYFRFKINKQRSLNQQQLTINKAIIESENAERFRIARDLHDSVGQMLSVVKMHVSVLDNPQINAYLDQTISEVRAISHNLIPEALNFGLKRALEELAEKITKAEKIEFLLEIDSELNLDKQVELNLFRIMQELIGNALKHANSKRFLLKAQNENQHIKIQFYDFGSGISQETIQKSKGLGWKNIYARLNALQAEIFFKTNPNYIEIIFPYVSE